MRRTIPRPVIAACALILLAVAGIAGTGATDPVPRAEEVTARPSPRISQVAMAPTSDALETELAGVEIIAEDAAFRAALARMSDEITIALTGSGDGPLDVSAAQKVVDHYKPMIEAHASANERFMLARADEVESVSERERLTRMAETAGDEIRAIEGQFEERIRRAALLQIAPVGAATDKDSATR